MPYLPATIPGMMVSNVALTSLALRPSVCAMASERSASMPTMVVPSGAKNSLGGYEASRATVSVPADFTEDGTAAASAGFAGCGGITVVGSGGAVVVGAEAAVVVVELLELLEQAAAPSATVAKARATAALFIPRIEPRTGEPPLFLIDVRQVCHARTTDVPHLVRRVSMLGQTQNSRPSE